MKRTALIAAVCLALAACAQPKEQKVMARFVPERADDFVWENNLVCCRCYGKALEGNPTSPGFDVWVKLPGALVANEWYSHIGEHGSEGYYHHDHGGKDCYKVGVSLGAGASAPVVDGKLCLPATNYRSWEILEEGPEKVVFALTYPEWEVAEGVTAALTKTVTVVPDTYFFKVEDVYTTNADSLCIAAGVFRHVKQGTIEEELTLENGYAIWEKASDTKAEPEEGRIGVAVVMPGAECVQITEDGVHGLVTKTVKSGETLTYYAGNCWSKGKLTTAEAWFETVKAVK